MSENNSNRLSVNRKALARIFSKIKISTEHFHNGSPCWDWQAGKYKNGYGACSYGGRRGGNHLAHRLMYQLFVEILPDKKMVCDHLCRRRHCVNPAHLEIVTNQINILRGESFYAINAAKTHCPRGHLLEGENLRKVKYGRYCAECSRINNRESYARKKARGETIHQKLKDLPSDHPEKQKDRENRKRYYETLKSLPYNHPRRIAERERQKRADLKRRHGIIS